MDLHISLTPQAEAQLRDQAAQVGKDPAAYVLEAVEEKLASSAAFAGKTLPSPQKRVAAFLEWIASHRPTGHWVDDSRETIYQGRGE